MKMLFSNLKPRLNKQEGLKSFLVIFVILTLVVVTILLPQTHIAQILGISTTRTAMPSLPPIDVLTPTNELSDTPSSSTEPQQTATTSNRSTSNYQNYGWYQHNGQSMQYLNGNWYTSPQQNAQPTQTSSNSNSGTSTTNFVIPTPVPGIQLISCSTAEGTYQLTQDQCTQTQAEDAQNQQAKSQEQQQMNQQQQELQQQTQQQGFQACYSNAITANTAQQAQCNQIGNPGAVTFCQQQAQQQANQVVANCKAEYPTN